MQINDKITFIGSGNMARAIIAGLLKAKIISPENIICTDILEEKTKALEAEFGIISQKDASTAIASADIVFLAIKPQDISTALCAVNASIKPCALIISIAAGISVSFIESALDEKIAVIRSMPNTPALMGAGATVLCAGKYADDVLMQKAKLLFAAVGKVFIEDEKNFDAVTALSGSGPAYVFYLCSLMSLAGAELGLSKELASALAIQTVYGAGKMLSDSDKTSDELIRLVKSPKGTTEAALNYLEESDIKNIIIKAIDLAKIRSQQLKK
jgi:pyrroline-5-carboxylate reductase